MKTLPNSSVRIRRSLFPFLFVTASIHLHAICIAAADANQKSEKPERVMLLIRPHIEYPYEARRARVTGRGVVVLEVDAAGWVRNAYMNPSTGQAILDRAAIDGFRYARFNPGAHSPIKIPMSFTIGGVLTEYRVRQKPMDQALAHFLGKDTVLNGPIPSYPKVPPWTSKKGKGLYELHINNDGRVADVKILKRSGDETFDRIAVTTLQQWRLRRGSITLDLPLSFTLTPTKYSVDIPKDL